MWAIERSEGSVCCCSFVCVCVCGSWATLVKHTRKDVGRRILIQNKTLRELCFFHKYFWNVHPQFDQTLAAVASFNSQSGRRKSKEGNKNVVFVKVARRSIVDVLISRLKMESHNRFVRGTKNLIVWQTIWQKSINVKKNTYRNCQNCHFGQKVLCFAVETYLTYLNKHI